MLCTPAMVYVSITFMTMLFLVIAKQYKGMIGKLIFAVLWTWLIQTLCKNKYTFVAWLIVILPLLLFPFAVFAMIGINVQTQLGTQPGP